MDDENSRSKFLRFIEGIGKTDSQLVSEILEHSEDRDEIMSLMEGLIQENEEVKMIMTIRSLRKEGELLFQSMQERDWLDWSALDQGEHIIGHLKGKK